MCVDISFQTIKLQDHLTDYFPDLKPDFDTERLLEDNTHIQAHARPLARIVYRDREAIPRLGLMRWGLLSAYMFKDVQSFKKYGFNSFNARSENLLDPSSAWYKLRNNRCLIDTAGIYEHRKIKGWKNKVPYYIKFASQKRMLIPALYNYLQLDAEAIQKITTNGDKYMLDALAKTVNIETGEVTGSFTMLTRSANTLMQDIHNDGVNKHRMPLFLPPEKASDWIEPNLSDEDIKSICSYFIPSEALEAHPVFSLRTTESRPDHKDKEEPYDWPGLPPLGNDRMGELF